MERPHGCCRLVSWSAGRRLEQRRRVRLVVLQRGPEPPVGRIQLHWFSSRKSGCRARAIDLRHGPRWSGLRRLLDPPPSQAGLTQRSQSNSNARGAGRRHGPAPLCVSTARLSSPAPLSAPSLQPAPAHANTPPPGPPTNTDPKPTGVAPRSCRPQSQPRVRRSARPERAGHPRATRACDLPPLNVATFRERISGGANQGRARDATRKEVHCGADHWEAPRG